MPSIKVQNFQLVSKLNVPRRYSSALDLLGANTFVFFQLLKKTPHKKSKNIKAPSHSLSPREFFIFCFLKLPERFIKGQLTQSNAEAASKVILTSAYSSMKGAEPALIKKAKDYYGTKRFVFNPNLELWRNEVRVGNPTISEQTDLAAWEEASVVIREFWQSLNRTKEDNFNSYLVKVNNEQILELKEKYAKLLQGIRSIAEAICILPYCEERSEIYRILSTHCNINKNDSINRKLQQLSKLDIITFEKIIQEATNKGIELNQENCFRIQWINEKGEIDHNLRAPVLLETVDFKASISLRGAQSRSLTTNTNTTVQSDTTGQDTTEPAISKSKSRRRRSEVRGFRLTTDSSGTPSKRQQIISSCNSMVQYLNDDKTLGKLEEIAKQVLNTKIDFSGNNINAWLISFIITGKTPITLMPIIGDLLLKFTGRQTPTEKTFVVFNLIKQAKNIQEGREFFVLRAIDRIARLLEAADDQRGQDQFLKRLVGLSSRYGKFKQQISTLRDAVPYNELKNWFLSEAALSAYLQNDKSISTLDLLCNLWENEDNAANDFRNLSAAKLIEAIDNPLEITNLALTANRSLKDLVEAMYKMYCT